MEFDQNTATEHQPPHPLHADQAPHVPSGPVKRQPEMYVPGFLETAVTAWPGKPFPLGATWDGAGVNFALFSANAEKVELCLFDPKGRRETARVPLPEYTHEVWHG
ncbi:MAG TPA: hypothetical protein VEY93_08775, partial [Longimicrobium sp.]|nr:hypothetical protein [Longimicrobium sp.]